MSWLTSWISRAKGGLESGLSRLENHEALVSAVIDDTEEAHSLVRRELLRVVSGIARANSEREKLTRQMQESTDEAVAYHDNDRPRALDAMRRLRAARGSLVTVCKQLSTLEPRRKALHDQESKLARKVTKLEQQREQLTTAERSAMVHRALREHPVQLRSVETALQRWQEELEQLEKELIKDNSESVASEPDALEASLSAELDSLVRGRGSFHHQKD